MKYNIHVAIQWFSNWRSDICIYCEFAYVSLFKPKKAQGFESKYKIYTTKDLMEFYLQIDFEIWLRELPESQTARLEGQSNKHS